MQIKAVPLTHEEFEPFGTYVTAGEHDDPKEGMIYIPDACIMALNCPNAGIGILYADPMKPDMDEMEMHHHTDEGWIAMDGPCVAAIGLPCADPNEAEFKAFEIPAGTIISLKPGVWHNAPLPCGNKRTTVLAVLPPNTPENDIVVVPLKETMTII